MSYVVLDLETTGLDYKTEQIIEIGAVKIDVYFNEIDRFHTMVSLEPGRVLPEFITKLTGINADDLDSAPGEQYALELLDEFIGDSIVVAQNAPFDLSFISRGGVEPNYFICTRALVRDTEPELSASLKDVTKRNGIELNGHHRALNDVMATIKVLQKYLSTKNDDYDPYNVVLDDPNRPLSFIPNNAVVRKVVHVALDYPELLHIFRNLPKGEAFSNKVGGVIERIMKGRA